MDGRGQVIKNLGNLSERMAYQDVLGVLDGSDDSGGEHKFFPSLSNVDDMDSFSVPFVNVWCHQVSAVLSADVALEGALKQKGAVRWQRSSGLRRLPLSLNMQIVVRNS